MGFGLVGAAMLSGLGQGIQQGVQNTTNMLMQEQRLKSEEDRETRRMAHLDSLEKTRQEFETKRDELKLNAETKRQQQGFTHIEAMFEKESTLKKELQTEEQTFQHGEREDDRANAWKMSYENRQSAEAIADHTIKSREDISREERKMHRDIAQITHTAAQKKGEINVSPDGSVSLINPYTGTSMKVIDDTGKQVMTKAPLDKATEVLVGVMKTQMDAYDYILKNPMLDDATRTMYLDEQKHISGQISRLLGKGLAYDAATAKTAPFSTNPTWTAWVKEYFKGDESKAIAYAKEKGMTLPGQSTPAPSATTPPAIPTAPSGGIVVTPRDRAPKPAAPRGTFTSPQIDPDVSRAMNDAWQKLQEDEMMRKSIDK